MSDPHIIFKMSLPVKVAFGTQPNQCPIVINGGSSLAEAFKVGKQLGIDLLAATQIGFHHCRLTGIDLSGNLSFDNCVFTSGEYKFCGNVNFHQCDGILDITNSGLKDGYIMDSSFTEGTFEAMILYSFRWVNTKFERITFRLTDPPTRGQLTLNNCRFWDCDFRETKLPYTAMIVKESYATNCQFDGMVVESLDANMAFYLQYFLKGGATTENGFVEQALRKVGSVFLS